LTGDTKRKQRDKSDEGKETFIVFFLGDQLRKRVMQICSAMDATILVDSYSVDITKEESRQQMDEIHMAEQTLEMTRDRLFALMQNLKHQIKNWKSRLIQEKSVCVVLNKFKKDANMLKIEG